MEDADLLRYSRQIMLPQFDIAGQERLRSAGALIIGLGGLGCPAALYLAAAGIGRLVLNDFDQVDLSNLQRQILHGTSDIGLAKTESARRTLADINPNTQIETLPKRLEPDELLEAAAAVDVILDCSDNFRTRFAVNAACLATRTPLVSAAVIRFEAQLSVFDPTRADSPCYNCLYPDRGDEEETCARNGVISALPGMIGSLQALEAIKLLSGVGEPAVGRLILFDALSLEWREMKLRRNPLCPSCAPGNT